MNREVHVRIWERPEVRALRATRHQRSLARGRASDMVSLPGIMTGQILGGVPLAEAVKSQILVMFRQKNATPQALSA